MATGAPNPAAPSKNAENEKAINNICKRRSSVIETIESRIRSNFPVFTVKL